MIRIKTCTDHFHAAFFRKRVPTYPLASGFSTKALTPNITEKTNFLLEKACDLSTTLATKKRKEWQIIYFAIKLDRKTLFNLRNVITSVWTTKRMMILVYYGKKRPQYASWVSQSINHTDCDHNSLRKVVKIELNIFKLLAYNLFSQLVWTSSNEKKNLEYRYILYLSEISPLIKSLFSSSGDKMAWAPIFIP